MFSQVMSQPTEWLATDRSLSLHETNAAVGSKEVVRVCAVMSSLFPRRVETVHRQSEPGVWTMRGGCPAAARKRLTRRQRAASPRTTCRKQKGTVSCKKMQQAADKVQCKLQKSERELPLGSKQPILCAVGRSNSGPPARGSAPLVPDRRPRMQAWRGDNLPCLMAPGCYLLLVCICLILHVANSLAHAATSVFGAISCFTCSAAGSASACSSCGRHLVRSFAAATRASS